MSSAPTQYCPNCGESNPIDAQSCWNCGQELPTSDERQELWATREDGQAEQDRGDRARQHRGDDPPGWARPGTIGPATDQPAASSERDPGPNPGWGGEATEPFLTSTEQREPQARPTRNYPATWGAPNPAAGGTAGQQRVVQDGDGESPAQDQTATTTPASPYGYGSGSGGAGQPGYGPSGSGRSAGAPGESGPPWFDQSGSAQPGYGQPPTGPAGYGTWAPGGPEGLAGSGAPDPYAQGGYGQGPYGPTDYGQTGYGPAPYGPAPYSGPAVGYAGGEPPYGGPVLAPAGSRGPSGCLLGALGVVLIALVGAVLVALIAYDATTGGQLRDGLRDVAATEVTQIGPVDVPEDGRLAVSEADVNRTIRRYTDDYGAISDPTFEIADNGVVLNFSVLGIDSSYRSGLVAEGGQLRLTAPVATGAAARVLSADDLTGIVEPALNDILAQSGVTATGVELGDGELTVLTAAAGATPAAGTPVPEPIAGSSASPIATGSVAPAASGSAAPASPSRAAKPGDFIGIFGSGASAAPSAATAAGSPSPSPAAPAVSRPSSSPSPSGSPRSDLD